MTGFKLRSEITSIEQIAGGRSIRDLAKVKKAWGKGRWRSSRGAPWSSYPRAKSFAPSYTGTRHTVSAVET